MAKFNGEITLENGMIMKLDMNAIAEFEEVIGRNGFEVLDEITTRTPSAKELRAFFFACLKRRQPDITLDEAGDVASEYPDAFAQVVIAASPEVDEKATVGNSVSKKKTVAAK